MVKKRKENKEDRNDEALIKGRKKKGVERGGRPC